MIKIGLTGTMASGKSTVAKYIREQGIPVFDADLVAKEVVEPGTEGLAKVEKEFGSEYLENGSLNRGKLAELVFYDKTQLAKLNDIIHVLVWQRAEQFMAEAEKKGFSAVVFDVPLLISVGWHKRMDEVWVVAIPREEQIKRVMARDGMSRDMAEHRLANQIDNDKIREYADVLIDNSGKLENTFAFVQKEINRVK